MNLNFCMFKDTSLDVYKRQGLHGVDDIFIRVYEKA